MSDKTAYLEKMVGREFLDELLADAKENQALLRELGVDEKELDEALAEGAGSEDEETEEESLEEDEDKEADAEGEEAGKKSVEPTAFIKIVSKGVAKELELDALSKWVESMNSKMAAVESKLDETQKSDEERLAEIFESPAAKSWAWSKNAPTGRKDNVIDEGDDLLKKVPTGAKNGDHWFSDVSGSQPLTDAEVKAN